MDLNSVNITATQVAKNYFSAYVENGFIYSYSVYGERQKELKMWFWKIVSIVMLNLMHWKDRTKLCLAY